MSVPTIINYAVTFNGNDIQLERLDVWPEDAKAERVTTINVINNNTRLRILWPMEAPGLHSGMRQQVAALLSIDGLKSSPTRVKFNL